jgi:hypothetical protein
MGSSAGSLITCSSVYRVGLSLSRKGLCSMNGMRNTPQAQPPGVGPVKYPRTMNPGGKLLSEAW